MAQVKWIKIVTDVFDDEKILLIESMPEADAIIVIWFKLLCFAGKQNNSGVFMMSNRIAFTDEMLATIFRRKVSTVRLALETFNQFGMIEIVDGVITIPNWSKHQSLDQLEERKEYMRNYMRDYREKQKQLAEGNKIPENGLPLKEWKKVIDYFDNECAYCGERDTELEQEHIVPVSKGGKYEMGNIIPACRSCNSSKQNKNIHEWYEQQEFYNGLKLNKIVNFCKLYNVNLRKVNVNSLDKNKIRLDKEEDIDNSIYAQKEIVIEAKKEIKTDPIDPEKAFEIFYKAYPRKVAKPNVIKWFKKHKPSAQLLSEMLVAIEKFKKTDDWIKDGGKFIPYPATWLNAKRWEDDFAVETMSKQEQRYRQTMKDLEMFSDD